MSRANDAEEARFKAFIKATSDDELDWIAFLEFERAVHDVADRAAIVNPYDDPANNVRETKLLEAAIAPMVTVRGTAS